MIYIFTRRFVLSLWLGAGIAVALLLGSAVAGQCAADSDTPGPQAAGLAEMSIEDLMSITVVTAGKRPETIANTAAAVFVITREDIERYGYQTLAQAVRRISGFYTETDRYIDAIGLRGYLPNGDLNRRVLVLVDGHKVNDALYGQAPVDQDLPVDLRDIERIEVVKGPGSALWGSEALLCVINCITKTASDIDGVEIRQDLGFRAGQHLAYGQRLPGGLEISGALSELKSAGQQRIYFPDFDSPETNNGIAEGLDGEHVGRGYLNMSYNGFKVSYNRVARVKDVATAHWSSVFNTPGIDVKDERRYSEISYENPTPYAKDGKLFCRIYRDRYDAICNWNHYIDEETSTDLMYARGVDWAKSWGAEARYSLNISSRVSAVLGAEYLKAQTQRLIFDLVEPYVYRTDWPGEYSLNSYYMQTDWNVTDSLRLVAGTRLDDHSIFGKNWSPRAGLVYKESPKSTLKLLYGKAFRSPSMAEIATPDNPDGLYPESINTTELVWDQQVGDSGRLVTSLFANNMYDLIRRRVNQQRITSKGIETQYDFRLKNGGSGYFGLSLLRAKYLNSTRILASSPQCVATWGMCVPVFGNRAYLAPDVQYVGSRRTNMKDTAGAYMIANLTLSSSSLIKNADVSIGITNLFDTPYFANAQPQNVQDLMPQGERTVQFQFTCHL